MTTILKYKSQLVGFAALTLLSLQTIESKAQNNQYQWVKQVGGSAQDAGYGVATDSKGNVYATGYFQNTGLIGIPNQYDDTIISKGNYEVFLTKMDKDGNLLWAHPIGGKSGDEGHAVTVDNEDNVIITGSYRDTVDFDPGQGVASFVSNNASVDVFVAKYDSTGKYLWAQTFGSTKLDRAYTVKTDQWNNVFITGQFYDTVAIPGLNQSLIAKPGGLVFTNDVFVCKLNAAGDFVWAKSFGDIDGDVGNGIATDLDGNVIITGNFTGIVDFDLSNNVYEMDAADGSIFLTKWDSTGSFLWARQIKSATNQGYLIETDQQNNIYFTGDFTGKVDFNVSPLAADTFFLTSDLSTNGTSNSIDGFILKLAPNADFKWVRQIGGSGSAVGRGVAIDRIGNPHLVGTFSGIATADTVTYTSKGSTDVFITKYDSLGTLIWATRYGGSGAEFCRSIAIDPFNSIYTVGHFVTTVSGKSNFHNGDDTVSYNVIGGYDAYVHKLGCNDTSLTNIQYTACNEYEYNNQILTQSDIYTFQFWTTGGCDSTVVLDLTVNYIDKPYITVNNFTLGITSSYASYQWYKNGTLIPNATQATLDVTENANYHVIVFTTEGCTDTSDVYKVENVSVKSINNKINVKVYPNPVVDIVYIESPITVQYKISSLEGKVLLFGTSNSNKSIALNNLIAGIYVLYITDENGNNIKVEKIIKY